MSEDKLVPGGTNERDERYAFCPTVPGDDTVEYATKAYSAKPASGFVGIGEEIGNLLDEKAKAYKDSYGAVENKLSKLWPDGIPRGSYKDLLFVIRITEKLARIAANPDRDPGGESPWADIAGYAILAIRNERR